MSRSKSSNYQPKLPPAKDKYFEGDPRLRGIPEPALDKNFYEKELFRLQVELVKMQEWIKHSGENLVVVFEGRDAAGKGGVIKAITQYLNPRQCPIAALPASSKREKSQWYFQRYIAHLPAKGEVVLFDRSWYNRAGVERVMGFCTDEEYNYFLQHCPEFENQLIKSGIRLIKFWFSVSNKEQEKRFQGRRKDRHKHWKLSPMDLQSRTHWQEYSRAKDQMIVHTDTKESPWIVVPSDDKKRARLNCIAHILSCVPYEDIDPEVPDLPPLVDNGNYKRSQVGKQNFIAKRY